MKKKITVFKIFAIFKKNAIYHLNISFQPIIMEILQTLSAFYEYKTNKLKFLKLLFTTISLNGNTALIFINESLLQFPVSVLFINEHLWQ